VSPAVRKAIIVEDEALIATDLARIIETVGAGEVLTVPTVTTARKCLDRHEVELAVLDIKLPDGDVFEIADRLLQESVPYIFVTAHERTVVPVKHRGAPFVSKPFNESRIRTAVIEAMLSARKTRQRPTH
jgi:two-component SAPR family response regulator